MNGPIGGVETGIRTAIPYLIVKGATEAIDWYRDVFGAIPVLRMAGADGRIGHAEITIGASTLYIADERPEMEGIVGPRTLGGSSVMIDLEVDDVETLFQAALVAGATAIRQVDHPTAGVQSAKVVDPFGHIWLITRVIEDASDTTS